MKIVAGLGSIDEYIPYAEAGADELFCGYIPESWARSYSLMTPMNRREVLYYNVQIGSFSELSILQEMISAYHVPVTITLNSLCYRPEQYPFLYDIICQCMAAGFHSFIVADPALLVFLRAKKLSGIRLHISGELAEVNHGMIDEMRKLGAGRIIFHRKTSLDDMQTCISVQNTRHPDQPLEYEAFALNEMCHFTGAFCNSLHCDELAHICHVPYRLGGCKESLHTSVPHKDPEIAESVRDPDTRNSDTRDPGTPEPSCVPGQTGCGLCALWKLEKAGITHLKLVSRGNYAEDTIRDIRCLRQALDILSASRSEVEYIRNMRSAIFKSGICSGACYYRHPDFCS